MQIITPNLTTEQHEIMVNSQKYKNFINKLINKDFIINKLIISDITWFGNKFGMMTCHAEDITTKDGKKLNNQTFFIRGNSSSILPIFIDENNEEYTLITQQARVLTGQQKYFEIPAGMIDENDFSITALKEFEEETGINLNLTSKDLVSLSKVYASPGGCDEQIETFFFIKKISNKLLLQMDNKNTGLAEEGEFIKTKIIPLNSILDYAKNDMKTRLAFFDFLEYKKKYNLDYNSSFFIQQNFLDNEDFNDLENNFIKI